MLLITIIIISLSILCAINVLLIIMAYDKHNDRLVNLRVYKCISHCTAPLSLKQFLKTFNYNFTLVYYKGD